nr:integrase, catalytic region, zinc finger, CCHC-type, peptidase aspartic, catalytic [Tanacetum cinerariifolium]
MTSIEDVKSFFASHTTSNYLISAGPKKIGIIPKIMSSANHGVLGSLCATLFRDSRGKVSLISLGSIVFSYGFSKYERCVVDWPEMLLDSLSEDSSNSIIAGITHELKWMILVWSYKNRSFDPVTDEAGPLYDSDILSEVPDHEHYPDAACAHHKGHVTHDSVQLDHVVNSHADYTSDSNMIPYDQYVKDNEIRLYCRGKENRVNISKSIDEGPYRMGIVKETLAESIEGAPQFSPERPREYSDLTPEEKDRYNADIRATNILLQGLPKDIYTLINHYTDAKDIWDNVKMLLEASE